MCAEQLHTQPESFRAKFVFEGHSVRNTTYVDKVSEIASEMEETFIRDGRNIVLLELATDNAKSYSEWLSQIYGSTSSWELSYVLHTVYPFLSERFGPNWPSKYKPEELAEMAKGWKGDIVSQNKGVVAYRMACYRAIDLMTEKGFSVEIQYEMDTPGAYVEGFLEYKYFEDINELKESHWKISKSAQRRDRTIAKQVDNLFSASSGSRRPVRVCAFIGPAHNNLFTLLTPELLAVSTAKTGAILGDDHLATIDRFVMRNAAGLDISDKEWFHFQEELGKLQKSA